MAELAKAASDVRLLRARWRLGTVTTFIDISCLQGLCCKLLIIICFLSTVVSRPTARYRNLTVVRMGWAAATVPRSISFAIMLQRLPVKLRLI